MITKSFLVLSFLISATAFAQTKDVVVDGLTNASEVSIAYDPTHNVLVAAANINRLYRSSDGGKTWNIGYLESTLGVWGDPVLYFGAQGEGYYVHLSNPPIGEGWWIDRIVVSRTESHGAIWSDGVGIGKRDSAQQDKAWITSDRSNAETNGALLLTWTEFDRYASRKQGDSSRILYSASDDYGETWLTPVRVNDIDGDCVDSDTTAEGAVATTDTNGKVFVVWSDRRGIVLDKASSLYGKFGKDRVLTPTNAGWDFPIEGLQRCNGLPFIGTDYSSGPHRGSMYILYSDVRSGESHVDVLMMRSADNGVTWSAPFVVNTDTAHRDHFMPAMAIDQATGNLYVVYYDRRATKGAATDVYLARSTDGGATFTDTKISGSSFTPSANAFMGDYIGIAAYNRTVWPIWTRLDSVRATVMTAVIADTAHSIEVRSLSQLPVGPTLSQNYPNPFGRDVRVSELAFTLEVPSRVRLEVFDATGRRIKTLIDEPMEEGKHIAHIDATSFAAGTYEYRLTVGNSTLTKMMTILP